MPLSGLDFTPHHSLKLHEKAWLGEPPLAQALSVWVRPARPSLHKYLVGVPQKDRITFSEVTTRDHCMEEQISPEILLQCSSQAKLALQRDSQPTMSAATPQLLPHSCERGGRDVHWVWDMASCQGWRVRVWVRCGSRADRQRGFPRA